MNHRACYKRSAASPTLGRERLTAEGHREASASIVPQYFPDASAADYGPRQRPTISDRQAAGIARHDLERRELVQMMCENRSIGGGY